MLPILIVLWLQYSFPSNNLPKPEQKTKPRKKKSRSHDSPPKGEGTPERRFYVTN